MDGVELSNTLLLEKYFGWDGIIAEPLFIFHEDLGKNRSCQIETRCVSDKTGELIEFYETEFPALSTISKYSDNDHWAETRKNHIVHSIETISLKDMLSIYDAPEVVDYLSIDTEGSELDILSAFDFSTIFNIITCEHNHSDMRQPIYDLLIQNGYHQIYPDLSGWEDWYIHDTFKGKNENI